MESPYDPRWKPGCVIFWIVNFLDKSEFFFYSSRPRPVCDEKNWLCPMAPRRNSNPLIIYCTAQKALHLHSFSSRVCQFQLSQNFFLSSPQFCHSTLNFFDQSKMWLGLHRTENNPFAQSHAAPDKIFFCEFIQFTNCHIRHEPSKFSWTSLLLCSAFFISLSTYFESENLSDQRDITSCTFKVFDAVPHRRYEARSVIKFYSTCQKFSKLTTAMLLL